VNKIPLRDAINSANTVTKDNYTGASWAAFTAAIASAQNALYNSEATNADITNAIAEMQNTRVKLIPVLNTASSSNIYIQDFSSFAAGNTFNNDSASLGSSNAWEKYKTSTFSTNVAADPDDGNNNVLDVVLGDDAYVAYPYDAAATKLQNYTYSLRAKMKNWTVGNSQEPWSNFQLVLYAGKNIPIETKNPVLYGIRVQMSDTTKIGLYKRQNADIGYGGGTNPYKVYDLPAGFDITQWHTYKIKADTANTNTSAKTADVTITLWIDGSLIGSWTDKGTNVYQGGFGFNAYGPEFLVDDICVTDNSSTIAAPTADIATGTYAAPISVNVTPGAAGEKMYYTLDGSDPSTNGMLYTGAIAINNSCTLKLIELNSSNAASNVISYSYTISAPKSVAPVAITNPRSMTVTASQPVSFQTLAYVTDGGTLTYQWQNSEDCGTTWSDIKGATDYYYDTAQVTAADNGTMYRCIITNTKNSLVAAFTTSPATLNITTLSLQPVSSSFKLTAKNVVPCDSVCNGKNGPKGTAQVTFTADTEGTYYYKLMYSGDTYVDSDGKLYIGYNDSSVTTVDTSGTGTPCVVGDNTISLSNIAPYVPYTIYIQEKDADGKLSNKLKVDIPAGKPNLTVATSGNGIVTQDVSGEYVSGSVVKLVATPAEGYHFLNWTSSDGGVFQNANSASTEYVTSFYDTTVTANFYQIASANLIKITTPAAITGLPNGTAKTAEALRLPAKVELVTDAGNVNANVTWDIDGSSYDPTVKTGQTFTVNGTVSLPTGVLNTNNVTLTTSIDVTVKAAPDTGDDIVPDEEDTIEMIRLSGANRYETCVKISQSGWKTSDYAVLATGEDFPDALSSAPLAKKYNAPILITNHKTLDSSVEKEIGRLGVKNIFIIGGTKAVSQRIEDKLTSKGIKCTRIQGSDRYETSAAIANHIGTSKEVVVATGENFPDALSIASYAAFKGMPILLTEAGTLPKAISKYIEKSGVTKTYVIGGMEVINDSVLNVVPGGERLNGSDRYATNVTILEKFASEFDLSSIYFATGENFPDALTGSAFAASMKSPIILVNSNITDSTSKFVKENISKIKTGYALGGSSVVPDSVKNLLTK
jgi:putative cell wall-binding protein